MCLVREKVRRNNYVRQEMYSIKQINFEFNQKSMKDRGKERVDLRERDKERE